MGEALYDALSQWLATFCEASGSGNLMEEPSDGVAMANALHRIDQSHFNTDWLSKVRGDLPSGNKRLKMNNLKKVLNGIQDYNADVLGIRFPGFQIPDLNVAAEGNKRELSRLIQLLLGCAVNCDRKQLYIENIMNMEESTQQLIMQAIQELIAHQEISGETSVPEMTPSDVRKMMEDLNVANVERDDLKQKCHELENQVNMLQDEKSNMAMEFERLQAQVGSSGQTTSSKEDFMSGMRHHKELKRQLEATQEDLYKMEKDRDESQVKNELLEKQLEESQMKEAELQKLADQARSLKDEVDILRETSDKVQKYEATIESYKKKLEELGDVKRQLKLLEDKNTKLVETNVDLEEDLRNSRNSKPQVDAYKRQITDLRTKLEDETTRADKLDFETKRLLEKVEALSVEKDRAITEREKLKETNDELQEQIRIPSGDEVVNPGLVDSEPDSGMLEMIPPSVKERLIRLQHENKRLKASLKGDGAERNLDNNVLQQMVDDLRERESRLESSNRKLNQKILELEVKLEESSASYSGPRVPGSREELELKLSEANKKSALLQDSLQKKEAEMQGMEERYKKYIEKAKSVIKTLDPKQNPAAAPEMSALRCQLTEKDRLIESLEQESEKSRAVREMEERLISSAFYNLSMQMHRTAVENRLSNVHSSSSTHGQSFLARQRQVGSVTSGRNAQQQSNTSNNHRSSQGEHPSNFLDYYRNQ